MCALFLNPFGSGSFRLYCCHPCGCSSRRYGSKRFPMFCYSNYHPISNDDSPKPLPLPYKEDGIYCNSNIEDKSIRPVSKMRLTRMDINYESIDKAAYEIVDSSIEWLGY